MKRLVPFFLRNSSDILIGHQSCLYTPVHLKSTPAHAEAQKLWGTDAGRFIDCPVSYPCQPTKRGGEFPGSNALVMTPAENNPLSPSRTIGLLIRTILSNPFQQDARGFIIRILRNKFAAKSLCKNRLADALDVVRPLKRISCNESCRDYCASGIPSLPTIKATWKSGHLRVSLFFHPHA